MKTRIGNNYAINNLENSSTITYDGYETSETASAKGIGIKTSILVGLTFISTLLWISMLKIIPLTIAIVCYIVIALVNLIFQLVMAFKPDTTKSLSIPYAIMEGLLLGTIVALFEFAWPGEGFAYSTLALLITIAIFLGATLLYSTGLVRVTSKFKKFMFIALLGLALSGLMMGIFSLIYFFASGVNLWALYYLSPVAIIISLISVIIASLYVFITIDRVNDIITGGMNKKYEWLAAYSILINIVWLFLEILRLIMRIMARNRN